MYPKNPAERRWGIHRASILPPRGAFAVRGPRIMHGARILPFSDGLGPAQGLLPEQLHRGIAFQRPGPCAGVPARAAASRYRPSTAWPLRRGACPPAPRQYPPPSNARHLPCPLQSETSRRRASAAVIRRMACSSAKPRGTADYIISGSGRQRNAAQNWAWIPEPWTSGRRTSGGGRRPGRACVSAAKTPIGRTSPSWRNYRNTPTLLRAISN